LAKSALECLDVSSVVRGAKVKILFVIIALDRGGAENQLLLIAEQLKNQGHDITLCVLIDTQNRITKITSGIKLKFVIKPKDSIWNKVCKIFAFLLESRKLKYDIVNGFMFHANIFTRIFRFFVSPKVLVSSIRSIYEVPDKFTRFNLFSSRDLIYKMTDFLADATTQVSLDAYNRYVGLKISSVKKTYLIHNGISVDIDFNQVQNNAEILKRIYAKSNEFIWICVANLKPAKDHKSLLYALSKTNTNSVLLLIGDGILRTELELLCKHLNIQHRVKFLGTQSNVLDYLSCANGFILTSVFEGFSNAVLEAMLCKLPCVLTNVGAIKDVFPSRHFNSICEVGNIEALTTAMQNLESTSAKVRIDTGIHNYNIVKSNFSIKLIAKKWENLYFNILKHF
jgi:glycosyltransferase involved in cell wall biosynthesis